MERMTFSDEKGFFAQFCARFGVYSEQVAWEVGRARRSLTRRLGLLGWGVLLCLFIALLAWWLAYEQDGRLREVNARLFKQKRTQVEHTASSVQAVDPASAMDGRARLKLFAEYLLPHQDIPAAIEEIFRVAEKEGLSIQRGEYRPEVENAGGFLRYHMTLPIKGQARAIYQFIQAVLLSQKNMALENVQFKRERISSTEIEVRIRWVLFTRLPGGDVTPVAADNAKGEVRQ